MEDSATGSLSTVFAPTRRSQRLSASDAGKASLGLAALRVVVQHVCLADQAVLSPCATRRSQTCYVVTCRGTCPLRVTPEIYAPALTSWNLAWNLCRKRFTLPKETADWEVEYYSDARHFRQYRRPRLKRQLRSQIQSTLVSRAFGLHLWNTESRGDVEEAETFLDLRSLAALRVVVGPDKSFRQMLNAVVSLRETKMLPAGTPSIITHAEGNMRTSLPTSNLWRAASMTSCQDGRRSLFDPACRVPARNRPQSVPNNGITRRSGSPRPSITTDGAQKKRPKLPGPDSQAIAKTCGPGGALALAAEANRVVRHGRFVDAMKH